MRYLDWDVLLFASDSKVPIQEFKTGCFITADPGTPLPPPTLRALIQPHNNHLTNPPQQ